MRRARLERARQLVAITTPAPILPRVERARAALPAREKVEAEMYELWQEADQRAAARDTTARRNAGHFTRRCPGCGEFTTNPTARHRCGWLPGRGWTG